MNAMGAMGAASAGVTSPAALLAAMTAPGAAPADDLIHRGAFSRLHYVAQLRRMFLVCESDAGMVILDQHAAAERVTFDRLRNAYGTRTVSVQQLLVPEHIEVTARDLALVEECGKELDAVGFELTQAGPSTVAIRAVPALLSRADPRRLARDVLAELGRHGNDFSRAMDLVLATMACHGSVRAGEALADEEARALLRAMDEVDFAGHCPHGRPVVWSLRWSELERRVGR
jgi:DNA mismatch repair protein MutL